MDLSRYDAAAVIMSFELKQEGDDLFCFRYHSRRSGASDTVTDLILDLKGGSPHALDLMRIVLGAHMQVIKSALWNAFGSTCRRAYILALPPHRAGRYNNSCEALCEFLAGRIEWLHHLPQALGRIETVQKAAFAGYGRRPQYGDHIRTIKYEGPELPRGEKAIVMLDDVYTRGDTSSACRDILIEATNATRVVGLFLGRTTWA